MLFQVLYRHDTVSIISGHNKLKAMKMTPGATTVRFYCGDCNSSIGMHPCAPTNFPFVCLSEKSFVKSGKAPAMRHSLVTRELLFPAAHGISLKIAVNIYTLET